MRKIKYKFEVPDAKKIRMIVHTDCKNEADDQYALVHHLLTPKFIMKGIVAGHFNRTSGKWGDGCTARASLQEVKKILELMDMEGICPVAKGAEYPLDNEQEAVWSQGAQLIIDEAMREDTHPLFVAVQGALTDVACAILLKPEICERMTVIWIGGGAYPAGGWEFNVSQDIAAANVVMKSQVPLWQIPSDVYEQMEVSYAELEARVQPRGAVGEYLFRQLVEFASGHPDNPWPSGESWCLGDSPSVYVLLERESKSSLYQEMAAPCIRYENMTYSYEVKNRNIRVFRKLNVSMALEDFYAKLKLNFS